MGAEGMGKIDDPLVTTRLIDRMEGHLPIPAYPTPALVRALRKQGVRIRPDQLLSITHVSYLGDEGGISCEVTPPHETQHDVFVSLTHLRIAPDHALAKDIQAYQRRRVRRITAIGS